MIRINCIMIHLFTLVIAFVALAFMKIRGFVVNATSCNISTAELNALEVLYYSTRGGDWEWGPTSSYGATWTFPNSTTSDPCSLSWQGITCRTISAGICSIEQLNLQDYNLCGSLPSEIGLLTGLSKLDLSYNSVNGTIPSYVSLLTSLVDLRLYANCLSGTIPTTLAELTLLQLLSLNENRLTSIIPPELYALINLVELDLDTNSISGVLPTQLSELKNLTYLNLHYNSLSSFLPLELSALTRLQVLSLYENCLTSTIPSELSALTNLTNLLLSANRITGSISSHLSALTSLMYIFMDGNFISSTIPPQLSALENLLFLDLDTNVLSKTIPFEISALTSLQFLSLYENLLSGNIPLGLSRLENLVSLQLNSNFITGTIHSQLSTLTNLIALALNDNKLQGSITSVLSNLRSLQVLYLNNNELSNSIPDMFDDLTNLEILDLHGNLFLRGQLPLSSLYKLKSSLIYIDLSNNNLSGDPFFFIGFPRIQFVNVSLNRFNDISNLKSASSLSDITSSLNYLGMNSNSLFGSLPDSFGAVFPALLGFEASDNCFASYIPESICKITNLRSIILNKLGSQCSSSYVSNILNTFSEHAVSSRHTIPSCLLALPSLQTAHFISNYLYGTLSEVSSSLESLSLVGNLLVGSIPKSVQQAHKLTNLQLSLNRLSGALDDDAFQYISPSSTIDLYSNRISGNIPSSLDSFDGNHVDILTGNLFYCDGQAPSNIKDSDRYSCGSSSIDFYKYVYMAIGALLVMGLAFLIYLWRTRSKSLKYNLLLSYFHAAGPYPRPLFNALANKVFLLTSLFLGLIMIIINLSMKIADGLTKGDLTFHDSYSTHEEEYGWASTFTYVHGILPFVLISSVLSVSLFVYLHLVNIDKADDGSDIAKTSITYGGGGCIRCNGEGTSIGKETSDESSRSATWKMHCKTLFSPLVDFFSDSQYRRFLLLQLLNIVVVTVVNVLYIFIEDDAYRISIEGLYRKGVPVALSIFKIVWSNTFVVYMIKYGIRYKLPAHVVFGHYVFASLYIYILVPIITVYFTDVSCFYYAILTIPSIKEVYDCILPFYVCIPDSRCSITFYPTSISQSITNSWIYSYQCGFAILINYIPAVLAKYTITGLLLPALKLVLLSLPPSPWIRNTWIVRMLMPYTLNAMYVDKSVDELDSIGRQHFRTYRYLSNTMIDVVMLFTFGIYSPFLSFIIVASLLFNELVNHMQSGSCKLDVELQEKVKSNKSNKSDYYYKNNENDINNQINSTSSDIISAIHSHSPGQDIEDSDGTTPYAIAAEKIRRDAGEDRAKTINLAPALDDDIYIISSKALFFSMWQPMLLTILLFSTLILFDIVADVYTNVLGFIAVMCFYFVVILLFYSRARMEKIATCIVTLPSTCFGLKKEEVLSTPDKISIVEMSSSYKH